MFTDFQQDMAERALYRNVYVRSPRRLHKLALRITDVTASSKPGPWVENLNVLCTPTIQFFMGAETQVYLDNIHIILLHTPNLTYYVSWSTARSLTLSVLSTIASSSIQYLYLQVDSSSSSLHYISELKALSTLYVNVIDVSGPSFAGIGPWQIPTLHTFSLKWKDFARNLLTADSALIFLSLCRFHFQCSISINIPGLSEVKYPLLDPLFEAHPRSASIHITMPAQIPESSRILTVTRVKFTDGLPSALLFTQGRLPMDIILETTLEKYEGALWDILSAVESREDAGFVRPTSLHIRFIGTEATSEFRWYREAGLAIADAELKFLGRLLLFALRLQPRGVTILDQAGKRLDAYTQSTIKKRDSTCPT
jgi:hypothetical protein